MTRALTTAILIMGVSVLSFAQSPGSEHTLRFEFTPVKNTPLHCENPLRIKPSKNDFELVDYSFMSSEAGERYALVTLKNTATGIRIFNEQHVVVIYGNCSYKKPHPIEEKFTNQETKTLMIKLGVSRFPALALSIKPLPN